MSNPADDQVQPDEVVAGIQAATERLGDASALAELPLTEAADRLAALHAELQGALTDLDRA